ncbi:unnamed protein product, partial [Prorocentrum cordatum]
MEPACDGSGPEQAAAASKSVVEAWAKSVEQLGVGGCVLLPLAWPERGGGGRLDAVLALVHRSAEGLGELAVVNPLGSGSEYHP